LKISAKLPYRHRSFVRGRPTRLTVEGLLPGEEAFFAASLAGEGRGPCYPEAGGLCLDILSPSFIGSAIADARGAAKLTLTVPAVFPVGTPISTQAIIVRGNGGVRSLKTNADTSAVRGR
jgi:hypothetical protein